MAGFTLQSDSCREPAQVTGSPPKRGCSPQRHGAKPGTMRSAANTLRGRHVHRQFRTKAGMFSPGRAAMAQWQYRTIDLNAAPRRGSSEDLLDAAGADGWELVTVANTGIAYLK